MGLKPEFIKYKVRVLILPPAIMVLYSGKIESNVSVFFCSIFVLFSFNQASFT